MALSAEQNEMLQVLADAIKQSVGMKSSTTDGSRMADKEKYLSDKEMLKAQLELVNVLKKYEKTKKLNDDELLEIMFAADKAKVGLESIVDTTTDTVKSFEDLAEEVDDLSVSVGKASVKNKGLGKAVSVTTNLYKKHNQKIKEAFGLFVEESRIARERSVADAKYSTALLELNVSMKDWQTILADSRDTQQAMAKGGRNFTNELVSAQGAIEDMGRSSTQAAKITALMQKNISGFGVKQQKLGGALGEQTKMYKENFRIWGDTPEAFAKSTEALLADSDIRVNLSMMQEKQRKEYILGLQAQESYRRELGYSKEEARELTKIFSRLGTESPKERMKKAAKQRAMMGALGMGSEGAELQRLMQGINQSKTKEADLKRIEEIQRKGANLAQQKMGESFASEMMVRTLSDKTGTTELFRSLETLTKTGKEKDRAAAIKSMDDRNVNAITNSTLKIVDAIKAFETTSVGVLGLILAGIVGGFAAKSLFKGIGKFMSGGKGGGMFSGMGSKIKNTAGSAASAVKKGAGFASGVVKKSAGAAASLGKSAMKSGIKKIPIIGALAGIGFGINRAISGDWLGAAGEVASGVASIIPGVGTAASLGIDAALAARDISKGDEGTETAAAASKPSKTNKIAKVEDKETLLINTLQELQTYLKEINGQNSEQALAVAKTGESIATSMRMDNFKGRTS